MKNQYNLTPGKVFPVATSVSNTLFKAFHEPGILSSVILMNVKAATPGFAENLVKTGKLLGGTKTITFLGFTDDSFEIGLFENTRGETVEVFLGPEIDPHLESIFTDSAETP